MELKTKNNPKVSIVLPVYNGERFLGEAIESILHQTYTDWELIIVNDCSTDSSRSIMQEYADRDARIYIVDNPTNLKLPRSLNSGFGVARGEYYTWTSDDNLLKPIMLETLVNELEKNPEYGMVYSDHDDIDESGKHICDRILGEPEEMRKSGNVCGASFLYRRVVADLVGEYDASLFLAEDYDYWMRVYSITSIKHINGILYSCRRHKDSLTATKIEQISQQTKKAIEKNFWPLLKMTETQQDRYYLFNMLYERAYSKENLRMLSVYVNDLVEYRKKKKIERYKAAIKRRIDKIILFGTKR